MNLLAGVVLYNPNVDRLNENLSAILPQVDQVVLVENGSKSTAHLDKWELDPKVVVIRNDVNMGIATALNQIMQFALDNNYSWALTLDQDSVCAPDIMETYEGMIDPSMRQGILCCSIKDRNIFEEDSTEGLVDSCITSGSYTNVSAWQDAGGFDDTLFIDEVDFDFCRVLTRKEWMIVKTNKTYIIHELGNGKFVTLFGKRYISLNHSANRYYYISRNYIYEGRKFGLLKRNIRLVSRVSAIVLCFEKGKIVKLFNMFRGVVNGFFMPLSYGKARVKNQSR